MTLLRRLFFTRLAPKGSGASVIQGTLTSVGVFAFLAGAWYLPTLQPSRMEAMLYLLLLACLALLCTAVGQLAVLLERLEERGQR